MSHFSSHTHSRPSHISSLSFATLTHLQSHCRPKLSLPVQALSLAGPSSVTVGLFCSLQNIIYIYIYCIQFEMFVSYESHLPSKGTRNHMTSLPSTQTESHLPSKGMFSNFFFFPKLINFYFVESYYFCTQTESLYSLKRGFVD